MYSKNKRTGSDAMNIPIPPPGYDGSRFSHSTARTDGRSEEYYAHRPLRDLSSCASCHVQDDPDAHRHPEQESTLRDAPPFPPPPDDGTDYAAKLFHGMEQNETHRDPPCQPSPACQTHPPRQPLPEQLARLLRGLSRDDILLIALIVLFAGEKGIETGDLLLLILLLCIS